MAKFRVWFDVHALPHEQYEIVDAPGLETAEAENCNRPHYLYTEPDEIVARRAYAIARIEARKAERAAFAKAAGISDDFNPDMASRWLSEG